MEKVKLIIIALMIGNMLNCNAQNVEKDYSYCHYDKPDINILIVENTIGIYFDRVLFPITPIYFLIDKDTTATKAIKFFKHLLEKTEEWNNICNQEGINEMIKYMTPYLKIKPLYAQYDENKKFIFKKEKNTYYIIVNWKPKSIFNHDDFTFTLNTEDISNIIDKLKSLDVKKEIERQLKEKRDRETYEDKYKRIYDSLE